MSESVVLRLLLFGAALLTFSVVIIFAGHGSAPVAALMIAGSLSAWGSSQLPGWLGALVSLAAVFARSDAAYLATRFWGVFFLVLSVGVFISHGEVIVLSAVTAVPLLGLGGFFLSTYLASWRQEPGRRDRPRQVTWAVVALGMSLATEAVFLLPVLWPGSLARETVIEALQFVALIVMGVQTWKGRNWARWGIVTLIVANRVLYARATLAALLQPRALSLVIGFLLLLDIAIVSLLLTPAASAWLSGRSRATDAAPR